MQTETEEEKSLSYTRFRFELFGQVAVFHLSFITLISEVHQISAEQVEHSFHPKK